MGHKSIPGVLQVALWQRDRNVKRRHGASQELHLKIRILEEVKEDGGRIFHSISPHPADHLKVFLELIDSSTVEGRGER